MNHPFARRTVNVKRAAALLAIAVVLGVGVHYLHAFQVSRNADDFLTRARQARADGDLAKSADLYVRYVGLRPADAGALAEYGLVLADGADSLRQKARAFFVLEQAVRKDPARDDARRRLARLALEIGRASDAREHLDYLKNAGLDDAELEGLRGQCDEAEGHYDRAEKAYRTAIKDGPQKNLDDDLKIYMRLASMLRKRLNRPEKETDEVMSDMLKAHPDAFQAYLACASYFRETGRPDKAAVDVTAARKLAPDEPDVLFAGADVAEENNDPKAARQILEEGLKAHPDMVRFRLGLASLELRAGPERRPQAVAQLREALKLLNDDSKELWSVADLFIDAGERDEAQAILDRTHKAGATAGGDYLQARIDFEEGKAGAAAALLERRRQELAASPDLIRQTDWLLGMCYEQLGNPDLRLAAFRRAADEAPTWLPGRLGLAAALAASGKLDEALIEYRPLIPRSVEARFQTIRLLIFRNRNAPIKQAWTEADALINGAPEGVMKSVDFRLTKAALLTAEGKADEARQELEEAQQEEPKEIRYRLALANLSDSEAGTAKAAKLPKSSQILDDAKAKVGDSVDLRLARAVRLIGLPRKEATAQLRQLEQGANSFDAFGQTRLFAGLGEAYAQIGATEDAVRLYRQASDKSPYDVKIRLRLFDLAVETNDESDLEKLVEGVRGAEGEDGALWRYGEAARLVLQARHADGAAAKKNLNDAFALLTEVENRRPSWPQPVLLQGEIEERQGDLDGAITKYQQAVALGERRIPEVRHAVELLVSRRRTDEAQQMLHTVLGNAEPGVGDFGRLAAELSLLNHSPKEAVLKLAEQAAGENSKSDRDLLWLGRLYWAEGERDKAEKAIRKAVALNPTSPEAWTTLIALLAEAPKKDAADAAMEEARKALPADQTAAVLAAGYEALGKRDKAEEQYLTRLAGKPTAADLRAAAVFYLRGGETAKALPLLNRLIADPENDAAAVAWARRSMAVALANGGNSKEALDLIDQNLHERKTPEDLRVKALILAGRPGGRKESIQTLEESFQRLRPTPTEEFLLARLYEADRDWPRANEHFLNLAGAHDANPLFLAYYIRVLLRRKNLDDANLWLRKLEKIDPGSARTVGLQARLLQAKGDGPAAAKLVIDFTEKTFAEKKDAAVFGEAAALLEELGQTADAEVYYRKYVDSSAARPEKSLALAAFLARHDRLNEALDLIDAVWDKVKPETAARTAVVAARLGGASPEQFQRVEKRIKGAAERNPRSMDLLVSLADLQDAEGRYEDAMKLYRLILAKDPRNVMALNNLSWLLAFQKGKEAEGLDLIMRALDAAGRTSNLLDTYGIVLLKAGRAEEAANILAEAAAQNPSAALYFHLAEAEKAADNSTEADKAWLKAKEMDAKASDVHPLEKADWSDLQQWMQSRKVG